VAKSPEIEKTQRTKTGEGFRNFPVPPSMWHDRSVILGLWETLPPGPGGGGVKDTGIHCPTYRARPGER